MTPIESWYASWPPPARNAAIALVFLASAGCEIIGGWLVWRALRPSSGGSGSTSTSTSPSTSTSTSAVNPAALAALGGLTLAAYGFVAALTPLQDFGRAYAAYGGVFVAGSFAWAAAVDGFRLDVGDAVGMAVVLAGVILIVADRKSVV